MRGPLAILLAVASLQFVAWILVLPAVQAPDEHTHFAYTQRLLETGERPPLTGDPPRYSPELEWAWEAAGLKALIGNLSGRPYWTEIDERFWQQRDPERDAETGPTGASRNPPLYYLYAGIGYAAAWNGDFFDRLFAMRLLNLPLYLLTIAMTWVLAGRLFGPKLWPRTIAAGAVAVQPQFAFVAAGISPDPMLAAIWAVFLVVAVRAIQDGLSRGTAAALVALSLVSLGTHPRGAPLALLAVIAAVLALRHRLSARVLLAGCTAALALVLVAVITRGGVLDSTQGATFNPRQFASYVWQFYLPRLSFMDDAIGPDYGVHQAFVETFYGVFASLEVRWPPLVYDLLAAVSLVGLVALVVVAIRSRVDWPVAAFLIAAPLVLVGALHFAAYRNLQIDPGNPVIVGRYLFPLLPLFGVAIAAVVRALPTRASLVAGTAVLFTGALLGLSGLGMTAVRFYV